MPTAAKIVREPRWPAFVAMAAAGGVYLALPERLSLGPSWLLLLVVFVLLIPIVLSHRRGDFHITKLFTIVANTAITMGMVASLALLIEGIPKHRDSPTVCCAARSRFGLPTSWFSRCGIGSSMPAARSAATFRVAVSTAHFFSRRCWKMKTHRGRRTSWTIVSGVQYQHGIFTHGYRGAFALGQSRHDAAVVDFADDRCAAGRPRRKYPLVAIAAIQTHAAK